MVTQAQSTSQYPAQEESYFEPYTPEELKKLLAKTDTTMDMPSLQAPQTGNMYSNTDDPLLKWLLDHKTRTIVPLKWAWRGYEYSTEENKWVPIVNLNVGNTAIMNEIGINWGISLLESYFNPVFLTTNMSVRNYNFRMRVASRFIFMTLCERYREFGLLPSNVDRVGEEIESKISALLAGAINDGYRRMLITQVHINENKTYGIPMAQPSGVHGIFSSRPQGQGY